VEVDQHKCELTLKYVEVNATEHVVPHDGLDAGMTRPNVLEHSTYVSCEKVDRQQAVFTHEVLTRLTQTHMKHLDTLYDTIQQLLLGHFLTFTVTPRTNNWFPLGRATAGSPQLLDLLAQEGLLGWITDTHDCQLVIDTREDASAPETGDSNAPEP